MFSIRSQLDETQIINNIRHFGDEIFNERKIQEDSFDFSISQSEASNQDRLIRPMIIQTSPPKQRKLTKSKFGSNYKSPYSKNFTSFSFEERQRMAHQKKIQNSSGQKIRRKIFDLYDEDKKIEAQKKQLQRKSASKRKPSVKSKFLQAQPMMKNLSGYIKENIYGRMKTETEYIKKKNVMSTEQKEKKWDDFIKKNENWDSERKKSRMKAKLQQNLEASEEMKKRPIRKSPPKTEVDECLSKLRRQADKLKEKLNQYTFEPKTYTTSRDLIREDRKKSSSRDKLKLKYLDFADSQRQQKTERKMPVLRDPERELNFML